MERSRVSYASFTLVFLVIVLVDISNSQNMRVAPGVPPQHYEHPQYAPGQGHPSPPPHLQQQFHPQQQVPAGNQQQFQQQQQVPQQFQQPQVPQFQQPQVPLQQPGHGHGHPPPVQGGHPHGHGGPGHGQPILDTSNIGQERQHIQDHMSVPIDTSQMSEQELQFHYFKMHDADNNNKLDGCELVKSLIHWHDSSNHDPKAGHSIPEAKLFPDDELSNMIDPILGNDDKNGDGYIDYAEFIQAQAAAAARSVPQHAA